MGPRALPGLASHLHALIIPLLFPNYLARGFRATRTEKYTVED